MQVFAILTLTSFQVAFEGTGPLLFWLDRLIIKQYQIDTIDLLKEHAITIDSSSSRE